MSVVVSLGLIQKSEDFPSSWQFVLVNIPGERDHWTAHALSGSPGRCEGVPEEHDYIRGQTTSHWLQDRKDTFRISDLFGDRVTFLKYLRKIISILWNFWSCFVSSSFPVSSASRLLGKESVMDHPNLNTVGSVDLQKPDAGDALFSYDYISKITIWMILKKRCALSTKHSIRHHLRAPALTEVVRDPGKRSWSCAG